MINYIYNRRTLFIVNQVHLNTRAALTNFQFSTSVASLSSSTIVVNEGDSAQLCVNIDEPQDVTVQLLVSILTTTLNEGT